ncbi:MAG: HEPN domain-containing protein [Minicystis sp.]
MSTSSIDHLPQHKRAQLAAMVEAIRAEAPDVGMILLFGSHARGNWVRDVRTGYVSDFDLLVVVERPEVAADSALWTRVDKALAPIAGEAPVTVLVHHLRELNHEIRRGQFFFAEIVGEGIVLYDSKRFSLARVHATTPEERRALAQEYFDHWFKSAGGFFKNYRFSAGEGDDNIAAFQLHQSTERYLCAALLVFTGTKPNIHDIEKLGVLAASLHPLLAEPFPRATKADDDLFKLLKRAYIEARYSKSYRITAEELAILGERVKDLAGRVERACREKIESFAPLGEPPGST